MAKKNKVIYGKLLWDYNRAKKTEFGQNKGISLEI